MRLLISVAAASEVSAAVEGGADIVDVKNPAEGSLGAPAPATLVAVRDELGRRAQLSAALGDAPHLPGTLALAAYGAALCRVDYVKVGLLGSRDVPAALQLLRAVRDAAGLASPGIRVVAVAYADAERVGSLPPRLLTDLAREAGLAGVMLDTAIKDGTSAFAALGNRAVQGFVDAARSAGLDAGLAGSLAPADLACVRELAPNIVGVRGAACEGGRGGTVSAARVQALREALGLGVRPAGPPALSQSSCHTSSRSGAAPAAAPGAGR